MGTTILILAALGIGLIVGFVLGAIFHARTKCGAFIRQTTRHEIRTNGDLDYVEENGKVLYEAPGARERHADWIDRP